MAPDPDPPVAPAATDRPTLDARALDAVRVLHQHLERFVAVVALDGHGDVRDLMVLADADATLDAALDHAHHVVIGDARTARLLILSSTDDELLVTPEADLDDFRRICRIFATWGVTVHDWLQSNGRTTRSIRSIVGESVDHRR